jgi:hypothetical protein
MIYVMESPIHFESVWSMLLYLVCVFGFVIGITVAGVCVLYLILKLVDMISDYKYKHKYDDHIVHYTWEGLIDELKKRTADPKYRCAWRGVYLEKIEQKNHDFLEASGD